MLTHSTAEQIVDRAAAAGVDTLVSVATERGNWDSSQEVAQRFPSVYYTLGIHPHQSTEWAECEKEIESRFANGVPAKCVGIGETGLDFHYDFADRNTQITSLEAQLSFAKRFDLPVVIHCREAFDELFSIVKRVGLSSRGSVMHCFTGTAPDAKAALDLGMKISFSGILTFRNADSLRMAAKTIPLTEIVLETDCPYLAPLPHRGKPNEPAYLPHTAAFLAQTLGLSLEAVAEATTRNAKALFLLPH